jgi:hypothetical protein
MDDNAEILRAILDLKGSVHYRIFVEKILNVEIERNISLLKTERNDVERSVLQGWIAGLEFAKNISKFEKLYKVKLKQNGENK